MSTEKPISLPLRLARIGGGGVLVGVGSYLAYENRAAIVQSVNELIPSVAAHWNDLLESRTLSQGEIFNPKASKGEISSQNSIAVPTAEAVKLAKEKSQTPGDGVFIVLSEIDSNAKIEYWKYGTFATEGLAFKGFSKGSRISLPYDSVVRWVKSLNGVTTVWIQDIQAPWAKENDNIFLTIRGKSFSIMNSDRFATSPGPSGLIRSSEARFKAGESIIKIESSELDDPVSGGGLQQLSITVVLSKKDLKPEQGERTTPLTISILADEQNKKAITIAD